MAERLLVAFSHEELRPELNGAFIELETEEVIGIVLHLYEDATGLSIWTTIPLSTPRTSLERAKVLNTLNDQSLGARFYQAGEEDII